MFVAQTDDNREEETPRQPRELQRIPSLEKLGTQTSGWQCSRPLHPWIGYSSGRSLALVARTPLYDDKFGMGRYLAYSVNDFRRPPRVTFHFGLWVQTARPTP